LQFVVLLQVVPQAVSWLRLVSQPLAVFESQSPYPELHDPVYEHVLLVQTMPLACATFTVQSVVHDPQCVGVLVRPVSQPFALFESQSP
jgi:hypothetical protein